MEMMPVKRRTHEVVEDEGWLITFADMCVLLMSFFILMFALSASDPKDLLNVAKSLREKGFYSNEIPHVDPLESLKKDLTAGIGQRGYDLFIAVSDSPRGVEIELASSALFEAGSAKFSARALPMLAMIAEQVAPLARQDVNVEVEGHTDDTPFTSEQFPTNWELSSARAANVVRYLASQDFPAEKMRIIGLGSTQPKADNRDAAGNPIPTNQDLNRRIVVRILRGSDN